MKRIFTVTISLFFTMLTTFGQVMMVQDGETRNCNFNFFDPGGEYGNYGRGLDMTHTVTSPGGERLTINFRTFQLAAGDLLYIYDGSSISGGTLRGVYSVDNRPTIIFSTSSSITFRFITTSAGEVGWVARIDCFTCNPSPGVYTTYGSPCFPDTEFTPFCVESDNPFGETTISSETNTNAGNGVGAFLGVAGEAACLYTFPRPSWYVLRAETSGTIYFDIEQRRLNGSTMDVDFACWGPFTATNQADLVELLCCRAPGYTLSTTSYSQSSSTNHTPPPSGTNIIDCSYSTSAIEYCSIPNAVPGGWYVLLLTNFTGDPGTIDFGLNPTYTTASTDCSITSSFSIEPACVGDSLRFRVTTPTLGDIYDFTGPEGTNFTTPDPIFTLPNSTMEMNGEWTLVTSRGGETFEPKIAIATIHAYPDIEITHNDSICKGGELRLSAIDLNEGDAPSYFTWDIVGSIHQTADVTLPLHAEIEAVVTVMSVAGCVSKDTVTIAPDQEPELYVLPAAGCSNKQYVAYANNMANSIFEWSTGETDPFLFPEVTSTTEIWLTVTTPFGCKDSTSIIVHPMPTADFVPDNIFKYLDETGALINFTDMSTLAAGWEWNFGDPTSPDNQSTQLNPSHNYTKPGKYKITQTVSTDPECTDSKFVIITIEAPFFFYLPTAFTPDGDGLNDEYGVIGEGFSLDDFSMRIFDRSGKMVFSTTNPEERWDGNDNGSGKPCQTGVYTCIVLLKTDQQVIKEFIESVTLYRTE